MRWTLQRGHIAASHRQYKKNRWTIIIWSESLAEVIRGFVCLSDRNDRGVLNRNIYEPHHKHTRQFHSTCDLILLCVEVSFSLYAIGYHSIIYGSFGLTSGDWCLIEKDLKKNYCFICAMHFQQLPNWIQMNLICMGNLRYIYKWVSIIYIYIYQFRWNNTCECRSGCLSDRLEATSIVNLKNKKKTI